jgi:hypothetical protein
MRGNNKFFKLDGNIDGTYFDENDEIKVIENMVQVVAEADGPPLSPASNTLGSSIKPSTLSDPSQLKINVNTRGHGIIYDDNGDPVAYKGELVFRDAQENVISLSNAASDSKTISEQEEKVNLRDKSLQEYNQSEDGIFLDDMIEAAKQNTTPLGGGNVYQAIRNEEFLSSQADVFTINLSDSSYVWITACAIVNGPATLQLRDVTTDEILDTAYIEARSDNLMPVYLSYIGTLSNKITSTATQADCTPKIWNAFLKKYFALRQDVSNNYIHQIRLEITEGTSPFIKGNVNMLVMGESNESIETKSGQELVTNSNTVNVTLAEPLVSTDYSISIQAETPIQTWYEQKSKGSFVIRFERPYNGNVHWTILFNGLGS